MSSAAALPVLFAGPAMAAPQTYNWTGFYLGLNAGGVWTTGDQTTIVPCTEPLFVGYLCAAGLGEAANAAAVGAAGSGSLSGSGFTGGVEVGYNLQNGATVYGVEVDFESLRPASTLKVGAFPVLGAGFAAGTPFTVASRVSADTLFTARGRLGWTFDRVLVYGTGGLAVTRLDTGYSYNDSNGGFGAWSGGGNKLGWTGGAGLEYALSKGWSVKAEYLYVKFGSVTAAQGVVTAPPFGYSNALSTSTDLTAQIARAGVNYKF